MSVSIQPEPVPLTVDRDGVMCVSNTRVTLDTVVLAFLEGATAEEIAHQYPSLDLADIYAVIAYYLRRRTEVESYLKRRGKEAAKTRKENERRFTPEGIQARLLARRRGGK